MVSENRRKGSVVLFMLAWLGLLVVGFSYLVTAPIPANLQLQEAIERDQNRPPVSDMLGPNLREDELESRDIKRKWLAMKPVYDEVSADYNKILPFTIPANGHLSEKQIEAMYDIFMDGVGEIRKFQHDDLGGKPGIYKAFVSYSYIPALVELVRRRGLVKHQMTEAELDWVVRQIQAAALFACNRQGETGKGTPEERKRLESLRYNLANNLGLQEERTPEQGGTIMHPEQLDNSKIPRFNVALFLKMHEHVRWSGARFYGMNFDQDSIMQAAQSLPE